MSAVLSLLRGDKAIREGMNNEHKKTKRPLTKEDKNKMLGVCVCEGENGS